MTNNDDAIKALAVAVTELHDRNAWADTPENRSAFAAVAALAAAPAELEAPVKPVGGISAGQRREIVQDLEHVRSYNEYQS